MPCAAAPECPDVTKSCDSDGCPSPEVTVTVAMPRGALMSLLGERVEPALAGCRWSQRVLDQLCPQLIA